MESGPCILYNEGYFFEFEMEWGCVDVLVHWGCGGSLWMFWFIGDVVVHWGCGGSLGMWKFIGVVVFHWGCGG